jgi:hypothetical protein
VLDNSCVTHISCISLSVVRLGFGPYINMQPAQVKIVSSVTLLLHSFLLSYKICSGLHMIFEWYEGLEPFHPIAGLAHVCCINTRKNLV